MGIRIDPNHTNLFVAYIEEHFPGSIQELYARFIYNYIDLTSLNRNQLNDFISFINIFYSALEFTHIISDISVCFLEYFHRNTQYPPLTSVFFQPTDSYFYIHYSSSHPKHIKSASPFSQFLHLRRLCSID